MKKIVKNIYKCEYCEFEFASEDACLQHEQIHIDKDKVTKQKEIDSICHKLMNALTEYTDKFNELPKFNLIGMEDVNELIDLANESFNGKIGGFGFGILPNDLKNIKSNNVKEQSNKKDLENYLNECMREMEK